MSWPIRLRLLLLLPWSCQWNAWVRYWTAALENFTSHSQPSTDK